MSEINDPTSSSAAAPRDNIAPPRGAWRWTILLLAGPLAVLLLGFYVYLTGARFVETDDAYVKANKVMISSLVDGVVTSVAVTENQKVVAGQVLFKIDDEAFRNALARAQANVEQTRYQITALKADYRGQQQELVAARVNLAYYEHELTRQSGLEKKQLVSKERLDEATHARDIALQKVTTVSGQLQRIIAELGGTADDSIESHPRLLQAIADRDAAALNLAHTTVTAPLRGVTSKAPQPGQYVKVGNPVISVVATDGVWIEASVKEKDLTRVQAGQSVDVKIDTYPDRAWHGAVASVSQATGAEYSVLPAQNATGNWVKVVQRIPVRISLNDVTNEQQLRAGMSAEVSIDTGYQRPLPHMFALVYTWLQNNFGIATAHAATLP